MNRREALQLTGAMVVASLASGSGYAASSPLRILILGGTGFIGPHIVEACRKRGHTLTLFNRGKRNASLFPDIETRIGDRNGGLDSLEEGEWDVVIDNSGYVPRHVRLSSELLEPRVGRYIFVSSISAYADLATPGIDEDAPTAKLADETVEEVTGETYGGLKALCEQTVERIYGERATIIRPTYIVGPGDPTDRFTYWPVRVARGGKMIAPGKPGDPIQFIDVRDLADFMTRCAEENTSGRFNVCNPPRAVSIGQLLDVSKKISKSDAQFVWADEEFLAANNTLESGEIPIWAPTKGEYAGVALVESTRAVAKGLRFTPTEKTVADTLAWHKTRPAEQQEKMRAGLKPEREAELLAKLEKPRDA
jgi:Nucleoside-diphosphate-sugar epimerases